MDRLSCVNRFGRMGLLQELDMKLIDITKAFATDEQCPAYLEKNALAGRRTLHAALWGVRCVVDLYTESKGF